MDSIGWIRESWHGVTGAGSGTWLAWAAWVALAPGAIALLYTHRQIQRNRRLATLSEFRRPPTAPLPALAPGQEWRTVWDSALDRAELGDSIESRFSGTVTYYDRPGHQRKFGQRKRRPLQTPVVLDWDTLPPVQRVELMTGMPGCVRSISKESS